MKKTHLIIALLLTVSLGYAQEIYTKAYGNPSDKPLLFLHGGPGYNAVSFELTTAKTLSEKGFYVICYDRRGEGRSSNNMARYTFEETFKDINSIYKTFQISSATLVGHSFGGIIATLYAEKHPLKTKAIVLVSTPISLQETFRTILQSSKSIYLSKNDTVNLRYVDMLEKMDTHTLEYSSYCFRHALQNGFYQTKKPTIDALRIYKGVQNTPLFQQYSSQMTYNAPSGFWKNEAYTSLDIQQHLKELLKHNIPVYGLYGKEDGLFSEDQRNAFEDLIGKNNTKSIENAAHTIYIDQQTTFVNTLKKWVE